MNVIYDKPHALRFVAQLGMKARHLFDQYKVWAFQTTFNLRLKSRGHSTVAASDCFIESLCMTGDTAAAFEDMHEWELVGFYRWYREVKVKHNERTLEGKRQRKAAREAAIMAAVGGVA